MEGSTRLGDIRDDGINGCWCRGLRAHRRILGAPRVDSFDGEEGGGEADLQGTPEELGGARNSDAMRRPDLGFWELTEKKKERERVRR
jgi:hypothetical protein